MSLWGQNGFEFLSYAPWTLMYVQPFPGEPAYNVVDMPVRDIEPGLSG